MNILIYGGGSLGLLFARYLSKKHKIEIISKKEKQEAVEKNGLTFIKDSKKEKLELKLFTNIKETSLKPEFIILSVKSFDIDNSLSDISAFFKDIPVITIQNGVYAESAAKKSLGKENVLPAYVMIGSKTLNSYTVEEFLNEGMKIGYLSETSKEKAERINGVFNECGIKSVLSDNIMKQKWHKMMFYCAGATLNSLTGTKNLEDENIKWMVEAVLDEITRVLKILNLDFDVEELASEVFEFLMRFKPKSWSASVGEDLKKGKKTEIDYLNGYIVKLAEGLNIEVPLNKLLTSMVKTIEKTGYFTTMNIR